MPFPQCSHAFEVSSSNSHIPRPSVTYRFPRNCKPSESLTQAFPFQDPLQLSVPPGLTGLQSFQDKLSPFQVSLQLPVPPVFTSFHILLQGPQSWREPTNFFANVPAKITDEVSSKT
jgi:hypothetical protein